MFDGLAHDIVLKAKARTGASGELVLWLCVGALLSIFAVVFLSIAAYIWLAEYFDEAIAAAAVGSFHILLAGSALYRCIVLRRRTAARALAELKAAEKQAPWWSDPAILAVGYEVAKIVGWRKLTPLVAAGMLAASFGRKSDKPRSDRRSDNGTRHAD